MSSAFISRLGTNYCPSEEELVDIQALLAEPTLRLKYLDDEITSLEGVIEKLKNERDRLGSYVAAHKALASLVRRLPLDILQEIFTACLPTHRNCVMSVREAPILLGRICGSWRALSISTPKLWSRLHIVEPTHPHRPKTSALVDAKLTQRLEVTKTWLSRSGQSPLSISLVGSDQGGHQQTNLFLQALIPFVSRWQHICFTITPLAIETLALIAETDVPILRSITFHHHPYHTPHTPQWVNFGSLRGPQISSFALSGSKFDPTTLRLRWVQLTSLSISGRLSHISPLITSTVALDAISRCPALRICELKINDGPIEEAHSTQPMVELSFIHTLTLYCVGNVVSTFTLFLNRLSLPGLRDFTLNGHTTALDGQTGATDFPSLRPLLEISRSMEGLYIASDTFSKKSLLESFRMLPPTMKRLRIHDVIRAYETPRTTSLDDDALKALTGCPAMGSLIIEHCNIVSDAAVLQFITNRMAAELPALRQVAIQFDRVMQLDIRPHLQHFMENGLDVSFIHDFPFEVRFSPWKGLDDAPS